MTHPDPGNRVLSFTSIPRGQFLNSHQFASSTWGQIDYASPFSFVGFQGVHVTGSEARERARRALRHYIADYARYADTVLAEVRDAKPDKLERFEFVRRTSENALNSILMRVKTETKEDADKVESVVNAMGAYIEAAEYFDDRAAMLANAVGRLESLLEKLDLLADEAPPYAANWPAVTFTLYLDSYIMLQLSHQLDIGQPGAFKMSPIQTLAFGEVQATRNLFHAARPTEDEKWASWKGGGEPAVQAKNLSDVLRLQSQSMSGLLIAGYGSAAVSDTDEAVGFIQAAVA
jgi:hypothetical protein